MPASGVNLFMRVCEDSHKEEACHFGTVWPVVCGAVHPLYVQVISLIDSVGEIKIRNFFAYCGYNGFSELFFSVLGILCREAHGHRLIIEAQWSIGYGVGLRIKRSSVRIRPWPLR